MEMGRKKKNEEMVRKGGLGDEMREEMGISRKKRGRREVCFA